MNWRSLIPGYRAQQSLKQIQSERDSLMNALGVSADSNLSFDELMSKLNGNTTAESHTAVYRCVTLIASAMASLPLECYEKDLDGFSISINDDPVMKLLQAQPAPLFSSHTFWEYITACTLLQRDAYALILRSRNGTVMGIYPLWPERVEVRLVEKTGRLGYRVTDHEGGAKYFDQDDILHFPGDMFDGIKSKTPIEVCEGAVKLSGAAQHFSEQFFDKGGKPSVVIEHPGELTPEQVPMLQQFWLDHTLKGKPGVLTKGATAHELKINNTDAQLLESRTFQVEEIARMFGVPLFMLSSGSKSSNWGTGIAEQSTGFVMYTLEPRNNRFEAELNRKIFSRRGRFVRFNVSELLRGDPKTQAEYFAKALGGSSNPGWMTQNEVRRANYQPRHGSKDADKLAHVFQKQEKDNTNAGDH